MSPFGGACGKPVRGSISPCSGECCSDAAPFGCCCTVPCGGSSKAGWWHWLTRWGLKPALLTALIWKLTQPLPERNWRGRPAAAIRGHFFLAMTPVAWNSRLGRNHRKIFLTRGGTVVASHRRANHYRAVIMTRPTSSSGSGRIPNAAVHGRRMVAGVGCSQRRKPGPRWCVKGGTGSGVVLYVSYPVTRFASDFADRAVV